MFFSFIYPIFAGNSCVMKVVSPKGLSDLELSKRFEMLFKQHFKPLCFYAMSFLSDEEVAKDIVHDVFLAVWKRREEIDFTCSVYPYFLSLTRNSCLNYLAHLKVKLRHERLQWETGKHYFDANDQEHEELIRRIVERMEHLPGRCGEVMYLCFMECKKYKEIAELLDISVNTVKTHLATGLKILRKEFPASLLMVMLYRSRKNFRF